jgi:Fur family ferric uptake transcriptional regulator
MAYEVERATLARHLESHSLKHTVQRELILETFLDAKGHITAEEVHQTVRAKGASIGYTTVYRTLKLLVEAGLAQERHFADGVARYEVEHEHHDPLVCLGCGKIVEFECDTIEARQEEIAKSYKFELIRHRHELYGRCESCQS